MAKKNFPSYAVCVTIVTRAVIPSRGTSRNASRNMVMMETSLGTPTRPVSKAVLTSREVQIGGIDVVSRAKASTESNQFLSNADCETGRDST